MIPVVVAPIFVHRLLVRSATTTTHQRYGDEQDDYYGDNPPPEHDAPMGCLSFWLVAALYASECALGRDRRSLCCHSWGGIDLELVPAVEPPVSAAHHGQLVRPLQLIHAGAADAKDLARFGVGEPVRVARLPSFERKLFDLISVAGCTCGGCDACRPRAT